MRRITIILVAFVFFLTTCTSCASPEAALSPAELLNLGDKYLLEQDYEQALVQFLKVIEVEPMNPRGYTGAAEAYVGLGDTENAEGILQQGLEVLPDNNELNVMLDELSVQNETVSPSPAEDEPKPTPSVNYEQLYTQYMDSDLWHSERESEPLTITSHKVFDFDNNGIPELWFYAEADNMGPRGPERADYFCSIEDETVKQLLSGYASGGSIGGDEIAVRYDTEKQTHVICMLGYGGGFGGHSSRVEVYNYSDGVLSKIIEYSQISQVAENYTDADLDGIHYPDENGEDIAIYKVNDGQVSIEAYDAVAARFVASLDEVYSLNK